MALPFLKNSGFEATRNSTSPGRPPASSAPSLTSIETWSPLPTGTVLLLTMTSGRSQEEGASSYCSAKAQPMSRATAATLERSAEPSALCGVSTQTETTSAPYTVGASSVEKRRHPLEIILF